MARISRLGATEAEPALPELAELLRDAVDGGASVGFARPIPPDVAERWWREACLPGLRSGAVVLLVAHEAGRVAGSVQLQMAGTPNGRHRAEVVKLLVHSEQRRRGLATALMQAAEGAARELGRTLLILDTQTGSAAESLYRRLGWTAFGTVPDFARTPDGALDASTFFFKRLD